MTRSTTLLACLLAATGAATGCASAPADHGSTAAHAGHGAGASHAGPYAGLQTRTIKALSAQQIADLRAGRGMSLALPAELNGYPGPSHTLELADALRLTPAQKERTRELFERMQREAKAAGDEVIAAETALDALFKEHRVTPDSLGDATARAAAAQGRLRRTHLHYHLEMMDVLTPGQVAEYARRRGY